MSIEQKVAEPVEGQHNDRSGDPIGPTEHIKRRPWVGWPGSKFEQRHEEYFADLLQRKWGCDFPGHTICVLAWDGQHYRISKEGVKIWVKALCMGDASWTRPPKDAVESIFDPRYKVVRKPSTHRTFTSALSRRSTQSSGSSSTPLLQDSDGSSAGSLSSAASSGMPGVGYYGGKALKWLGEKSIGALEEAIILKRIYDHLSCLKKWERSGSRTIETDKQTRALRIVVDTLELSRLVYPARTRRSAASLGERLLAWANSCSSTGLTQEIKLWLTQLHACLVPLALVKEQTDPSACDVFSKLTESLSNVTTLLIDPETTSVVICILASELAFSPYTVRHPWLGSTLIALVGRTLEVRPLGSDELDAIRDIAFRRLEENDDGELGVLRPWELAILAECASQDPWFKEAVLGTGGLHKLVHVLELSPSKLTTDPVPESVSNIALSPYSIPELSLDSIPEFSLDSIPGLSPDTTPEPTPELEPDTVSELAPDPVPELVLPDSFSENLLTASPIFRPATPKFAPRTIGRPIGRLHEPGERVVIDSVLYVLAMLSRHPWVGDVLEPKHVRSLFSMIRERYNVEWRRFRTQINTQPRGVFYDYLSFGGDTLSVLMEAADQNEELPQGSSSTRRRTV